MPIIVDLERIQKIFARRGERVVIIMPESEPLVLVPLNEYEQFQQAKLALTKTSNQPQVKINKNQNKPQLSQKLSEPEPVDPLEGGLDEDDQYFPEPM